MKACMMDVQCSRSESAVTVHDAHESANERKKGGVCKEGGKTRHSSA